MAAALAALQLVAGGLSLRGGDPRWARTVRPVAAVQGLLAVLSFAALVIVFWQTDLSVKLVAMNSHSAKPLLYKIARVMGEP